LIELLQPDWAIRDRVGGAFGFRGGGVSVAPWRSLNLGTHVGDDPAAVAENRRRLAAVAQLPGEPLWLQQVHGAEVCDADALGPESTPPIADAAFTRTRGRVLAVLVADCLPVLIADEQATVVAVAHAGWRGLAAGVIERAVAATTVAGARLHAWLGPCISTPHFEVGAEVRATFIAHDPAAASAFTANAQRRWQCDLVLLARQRLAALGIRRVSDSGVCTFADESRCFSHRRDGREGQTGRMAALVWLRQ
jgi:YfiH family protein